MTGDSVMSPILICGCGRSGTSILGEYIAAHPQVSYQFERHEWRRWVGLPGFTLPYTDAVGIKIRAFVSDLAQGRRFAEKNGAFAWAAQLLYKALPTARFVYIIRDGRDVACSRRTGWTKQMKDPVKRANYARKVLDFPRGDIRNHGKLWLEVVAYALEQFRNIPSTSVHFVRYEELVSSPTSIGMTICKFLNLDYVNSVAEFAGNISDSTASPYHAKRQDVWFENDHSTRVERWKENLTLQEQHDLTEYLAPMLQRLDYLEEEL